MQIINDIGDDAIFHAIMTLNSKTPDPDILRVTELIDSPQVKRLKIKHWHNIVVPASRFLYSLRGSLMHGLVAGHQDANTLTEEKLSTVVNGVKITGTPDKYEASGLLIDYKYTSMWAFTSIKPEWSSQLNVYAYLLFIHGFNVEALQIRSILDDWSASKATYDKEYPQTPFKKVDIPLWKVEDQESFIRAMVLRHQTEGACCHPEEQWQKPTTYAVMKEGLKRAKAVFGTETRPGSREDAETWIKENTTKKDEKLYSVVERPGRNIRCEAYCLVAPFCSQWKSEKSKYTPTEE